jgi:hypothetical protein
MSDIVDIVEILDYQRWIRYWNMSTRQLNIGSKPLLPLAARLITNYKLLISLSGIRLPRGHDQGGEPIKMTVTAGTSTHT